MNEATAALPPGDKGQVTSDTNAPTKEGEEILSPVTRHLSPLKLAIVGRPNVGKSSIINELTQSKRVIVSPIPGTTRDAIDVPFEVKVPSSDGRGAATEKYILIDTAGMRKTRRVDDSIKIFQRPARRGIHCAL